MKKNKINKLSYNRKLQNNGYYFVLPAIILFLVFIIWPMANSFYLSFFKWNMVSPEIFVGFDNYKHLVTDIRFLNSFKITVIFTVVSVALIMIISFWLAYALTIIPTLRRFYQSVFFFPVVLSLVGMAVSFRFIFHNTGPVNSATISLFHTVVPWLSSVKIANYTTAFITVWKISGIYMMIFFAGFLNVPAIYYEAAKIDGAGFWGKLIHITIPCIKNTIILVFISCVIILFGAFPIQYVLTGGGPSNATEVLALYIYRIGFIHVEMGYASTVSVIYFLSLFIFAITQIRLISSQND